MKKIVLIIILVVSLIWFSVVALNPLRWPEVMLANRILSNVSIGTHIDDVHLFIESNPDWEIRHTFSGYYIGRFASTVNASRGRGRQWQYSPEGREGEYRHGIWINIGEYRTLTITAVSVLFVFDADGYLIDVFIQKSTDAI